jgi:hypothetical protein
MRVNPRSLSCMASPPESLPPEVLAAFERGQPIQAIKLLLARRASAPQAATPQAKRPPSAVPPRPSSPASTEFLASGRGLSPGEVPRSISAFWGWVVAVLLAYVAYRLLLV